MNRGKRKAIDVREVIKKSTSEIQLEELQKKGFQKVRVLDKAAIDQMICDAVDRVVEERLHEVSGQERAEMRRQAKAEFDQEMASFRESKREQEGAIEQRQDSLSRLQKELDQARSDLEARERQVAELEASVIEQRQQIASSEQSTHALKDELEQLRAALEQRAEELVETERRLEQRELEISERAEAATEAAKSADFAEIKEQMQALMASMANRPVVAGGATNVPFDDAAAVEAVLNRTGQTEVESNLEKVEVKNAQAKGVNKNLEKLKSLKKGTD